MRSKKAEGWIPATHRRVGRVGPYGILRPHAYSTCRVTAADGLTRPTKLITFRSLLLTSHFSLLTVHP